MATKYQSIEQKFKMYLMYHHPHFPFYERMKSEGCFNKLLK